MSPEAKAADHVYRRLKSDVMAGDYAPSAILNVQQIATEIGVSISPVRDAIERLVGERLLTPRAGGGFQVPAIHEAPLRDLYLWHGHLVRWAVSAEQMIKLPDALLAAERRGDWGDNEAIVEATIIIFIAIGSASGSAEHVHALQSASDRLHAVRLHEDRVIKDRRSELSRLIGFTAPGRESQLRNAISGYHHRRVRLIPSLVSLLSEEK